MDSIAEKIVSQAKAAPAMLTDLAKESPRRTRFHPNPPRPRPHCLEEYFWTLFSIPVCLNASGLKMLEEDEEVEKSKDSHGPKVQAEKLSIYSTHF